MFLCISCLFFIFVSIICFYCLNIVCTLFKFSCIYKTDKECLFLDMSLSVNKVTKMTHIMTCNDKSKQTNLINYRIVLTVCYNTFLTCHSLKIYTYHYYEKLTRLVLQRKQYRLVLFIDTSPDVNLNITREIPMFPYYVILYLYGLFKTNFNIKILSL